MLEGHWIIQDHYLTVRRWKSDFVPTEATIDATLAWIRFPGLSTVYYDENALRATATCIDQPVKIDSNIALATIGKFARICVEVDLTKPLVGQFLPDGKWQKVEYEGLCNASYLHLSRHQA